MAHGTDQTSSANHTLDGAIDLIGGCMGGTASVYVGQPLDTVKVKMQTFPTEYKSGYACLRKTFLEEGIVRGLYAGTVPSLAAQVSENAVLFLAYGFCQKAVMKVVGKSSVKKLSVFENACAGGTAAFFAAIVLTPTELVKCRLQAMEQMRAAGKLEGHAGAKGYVGPWGLTKDIVRSDGVRGLFRGFVPTVAREMPGYFFFFGGYEISRAMLTPPGKTKDEIGAIRTILSGGIGGVALWVAIFPADVIKSRVQVQTEAQTIGFFGMMMKIAREEGWRALYKGVGPAVCRTFPATGALFLAYETTKKVLRDLAGVSDL